jgi:hypothetical protein
VSSKTVTQASYYPILAILWLVRSRVFWILLVIGIGLWFAFRPPPPPPAADPKAPITFRPDPSGRLPVDPLLLESALGKFYAVNKRLPTNWTEFKATGLISNMPPAKPGHRYVFDPTIGLLKEESLPTEKQGD